MKGKAHPPQRRRWQSTGDRGEWLQVDLGKPEEAVGAWKALVAADPEDRGAAAALLIAFAWACESHQIASPETASLNVFASTEDVEVQAATLQWLIDNKSATGLDAQCVSVGYPEADLDPGADLLSRGEEISGGRDRQSSLADAYEAVVGALFLDSNYDTAREFILREFADVFGELQVLPTIDNPKGELQELLQGQFNEAPQYKLEATTGPDHDRVFECTVHFRGKELGRGSGGRARRARDRRGARSRNTFHAAAPGRTSCASRAAWRRPRCCPK